MKLKFLRSVSGEGWLYRIGDVIEDDQIPAVVKERLLERGVCVVISEPKKRKVKKAKDESRSIKA
jgi:hypothetical protein